MKKTILLAFLGAGLFTANAQTNQATLNVILSPVQSIIVNATPVELNYVNAKDYTDGVSSEAMSDHLTVYSTGGFQVSVSVPSDTFGNGITDNNVTINASGITVLAAKGSTDDAGSTYLPAVSLSVNAKPLFSSKTGGTANKYNVTYKGAGGNAYVGKKHTIGAATTTYTTLVTYSIAAN